MPTDPTGSRGEDPASATPLLYTHSEAAELLRISRDTLYDLGNSGAIAYVIPGGGRKRPRRYYVPADLEAFIAARRVQQSTPPEPPSATGHRPRVRLVSSNAPRRDEPGDSGV